MGIAINVGRSRINLLSIALALYLLATGALVTYLAMAQTLSGCLQNFVGAVDAALLGVFINLRPDATTSVELVGLAKTLHLSLKLGCGIIWGGLIYAAPAVFLYRALVPRWGRWLLGGGYVALVLVVFWVSAHPYQIKARAAGEQTTLSGFFVRQFWQPALWGTDIADLIELEKQRTKVVASP